MAEDHHGYHMERDGSGGAAPVSMAADALGQRGAACFALGNELNAEAGGLSMRRASFDSTISHISRVSLVISSSPVGSSPSVSAFAPFEAEGDGIGAGSVPVVHASWTPLVSAAGAAEPPQQLGEPEGAMSINLPELEELALDLGHDGIDAGTSQSAAWAIFRQLSTASAANAEEQLVEATVDELQAAPTRMDRPKRARSEGEAGLQRAGSGAGSLRAVRTARKPQTRGQHPVSRARFAAPQPSPECAATSEAEQPVGGMPEEEHEEELVAQEWMQAQVTTEPNWQPGDPAHRARRSETAGASHRPQAPVTCIQLFSPIT